MRHCAGRGDAWRYFLWLSFVFNALVACGYVLVGAAAGFGDWPVLLAGVQPSWAWRLPAGFAALVFYVLLLKVASRAFSVVTGLDAPSPAERAALILIPTGAAALVALAAEIYGGRADPASLSLAFGCTLFVGLTLLGVGAPEGSPRRLHLPFRAGIVVPAAIVAVLYVLVLGPGLVPS